jgi:hypothetical protein
LREASRLAQRKLLKGTMNELSVNLQAFDIRFVRPTAGRAKPSPLLAEVIGPKATPSLPEKTTKIGKIKTRPIKDSAAGGAS